MVKSVAVSDHHWKFLATVTKMYGDAHYLPQVSLPFHHVFLQCKDHPVESSARLKVIKENMQLGLKSSSRDFS